MKLFDVGSHYVDRKNMNIKDSKNDGRKQLQKMRTEKPRKDPRCAMCQNHGEDQKTKNHKSCVYKTPEHLSKCDKCRFTNQRRISISKEIKMLRDRVASRRNHLQVTTLSSGGQRRQQMCRKCGFHGKIMPMRKHKKVCPFIDCVCDKGCKEVESRCTAFNNEAKIKRRQRPKQPKFSNVQVTPIDEKLPEFSSIFCATSQPIHDNQVQFSSFNYSDAQKGIDCSTCILDPFCFLNLNQIQPNKTDLADQFQTLCSVTEPKELDLAILNQQINKNKYAELDAIDYDIEIASVIANFANENFYSLIDEMDFSDGSISSLESHNLNSGEEILNRI